MISNVQFSVFFYHIYEHACTVEFISLFWQTRRGPSFQLYTDKAVEEFQISIRQAKEEGTNRGI